MSSKGWRPDRGQGGKAAGPYMHASNNSDANNENVEVGLGLLRGENGDVMSANAQLGMWGQDDGRATRMGARGNAQMLKGQAFSDDWGVGAEGGVFTANAEASIGNDGLSIGAGANIVEGAVTMGGFNKDDSWADSQLRLGAGYGVGFGGRLHWGDSDGDGVREMGLGVDFGPFSGDFKTEALGHAWNWAGDTASDAWDTAGDAADWVGDTASDAWDTAGDAADWVGDTASDAWSTITSW